MTRGQKHYAKHREAVKAKNAATFSDDGVYRYWLCRVLNPYPKGRERRLIWIMLNPSTADCTINDPTVKRCMGYAVDWGFDSMEIVNLFAFRATDPRELRTAADPVGPENDYHLLRTAGNADLLMCGWGATPIARKRAADVYNALGRLFPMHCIGTTQSGMPLHPLYQPSDAQPRPWSYPQ